MKQIFIQNEDECLWNEFVLRKHLGSEIAIYKIYKICCWFWWESVPSEM
jgi:hypothetical protein